MRVSCQTSGWVSSARCASVSATPYCAPLVFGEGDGIGIKLVALVLDGELGIDDQRLAGGAHRGGNQRARFLYGIGIEGHHAGDAAGALQQGRGVLVAGLAEQLAEILQIERDQRTVVERSEIELRGSHIVQNEIDIGGSDQRAAIGFRRPPKLSLLAISPVTVAVMVSLETICTKIWSGCR